MTKYKVLRSYPTVEVYDVEAENEEQAVELIKSDSFKYLRDSFDGDYGDEICVYENKTASDIITILYGASEESEGVKDEPN